MMDNTYIIRRIESPGEAKQLEDFFNEIFHPEKVGDFANALLRHFPGMKNENWYVACEKAAGQIVSAFALIPWTWEFEGVTLKVGEMGIVGTQKDHRKKGLMNRLEAEFSTTLEQEKYDLSVIQGIPGFYHRYGYYYAVPLENHINLPLYLVRDTEEEEPYTFRPGETKDIPYFLDQDRLYRSVYSLGCVRSELCWEYLLIKSKETIYGSEIWIMEQEKNKDQFPDSRAWFWHRPYCK